MSLPSLSEGFEQLLLHSNINDVNMAAPVRKALYWSFVGGVQFALVRSFSFTDHPDGMICEVVTDELKKLIGEVQDAREQALARMQAGGHG